MVMRRTDNMKRKRKEECTSPLLDDSPKRTKVHAQRKFAQGSNVNSPVITPVKEIETERSPINVLPEPVELLPIKRPNTEDFLTFLCFRGTPILPPNLNFFNTASIVDTNGQVHEIKSESPKNGPIDTSVIAKCGSSTEKPFIAYGVRKRADPIVISKQMDRKRRHALAIQALRRKYQEQKMAKIRALTISKLSEKVTNKTLVRTNSVSKTETITKKTNTIEKTKVVATKHVKVTTQTLKTTLRPKKMCLRSFRGRFVQRELQFRSGGKRRPIADKKPVEKKSDIKNEEPTSDESEYSSDDHAPLSTPATSNRVTTRQTAKIIKKPAHLTTRSTALGSRVTRSGHLINKIDPRRQQIKKRMLLTSTQTIIKPRSLRSTTIRKTVLSKMPSATLKIKRKPIIKEENIVQKAVNTQGSNKSSTNVKQDVKKLSVNVKKSLDIKKEINKVEIKKETCKSEVKKDNRCNENKKEVNKSKDVRDVRKELNKSVEIKKEIKSATLDTDVKKDINVSVVEKSKCVLENSKKDTQSRRSGSKTNLKETDEKSTEESEKIVKKVIKKESTSILKKEVLDVDSSTVKNKERSPQTRSEKTAVTPRSTRPSRKTKEAAAIYMELLSQKLVHDSKLDDDDSTSIDSFPELPNVKRTEQRENELKAQAKNTKSDSKSKAKGKNSDKKDSTKKNVDTEQEDEKELSPEKKKSLIKRKSNNCDSDQNDNKKLKLNKNESKEETKATLESPVKTKIEETKQENTESKRQTRNSSQNIKLAEDSEDSDESFHADIKIPRQKKVTRSSTVQPKIKVESEDEELNELIKRVQEQESSIESDSSVTSSNKSKSLKCKTKKFSKIKSKQNTDVNFSDSDEEPLSKLTTKNTETSQKSSEVERSTRRKSDTRRSAKSNIESETNQCAKPKRECAKRPQNYLPMFSSTDEEDEYFDQLGKVEVKTPKLPTEKPASDLLSKDVKRRFGKEKVNMSNEQIEKWLKDSAMAGNDVKSENDAMLKFGECIPTETTLETNDQIDTAKLKSSLLNDVKSETFIQSNNKEKLKLDIKPQALDRKLIFKKAKKEPIPIPNVNAFSPENESSVYAFGDDHDETPSTPFRRPSRRPSSTATSKSEDELSKVDEYYKMTQFRKPSVKQETVKVKEEIEEENLPHFNMPQKPSISKKSETQSSNKNQKSSKTANLDVSDDVKYKVPSSPSASSSSSAKLSKKQTAKIEFTIPTLVQDFPAKNAPAQLVEAPVFHPSEQEFQDPIEYIERIRNKAEQFGICKIVPPSNFKPECKVSDDMRFTAYNQYVHKMLHRWGPNFKELMAIKKYLETQNISLSHPPWIGGMEIDLPRLYQTVQNLGGLKEVIEKKKWPRVSECMKIPKSAQDRVTKLDDIYCKYLLPYDTLSPAEREKLFDEVETEWAKRESKSLIKAQQDFINDVSDDAESESDDDEIEECIVKGRNMALNAFYRIARNTMSMYFKTTEPPAQEVEQEFWRHVSQRQNHICVHSGSIDSGSWGYGFSVSKNSPFARHAWNLKVLTNNSGSVLRSMGPIMGVTVPTLHVGMVFSACCWYRDPHGLPWVEYLHTGGNKIWYGIPNSSSELFHTTMKKLVPNYCRNKNLWLPSDTAMVPPNLLVDNNVSLCRVVQEPGQFIVVFPKAFTSSISTGYVVSESVYFATPYWLKTARSVFDDLKNSCEPSMFSFERLLISITTDTRSNIEVLKQILPSVQEICDNEKMLRDKLKTLGNIEHEKLPLPEGPNSRRKKKIQGDDNDYECEICRKNLFVSMVFDSDGDVVYCLEHAIKMLEDKKITLSKCKLMFTYAYDELDGLVKRIHSSIELKMQKKIPNKYAGMPTLLTK